MKNEMVVGLKQTAVDEAAKNLPVGGGTPHKRKKSRWGLKGELGGGAGFLNYFFFKKAFLKGASKAHTCKSLPKCP